MSQVLFNTIVTIASVVRVPTVFIFLNNFLIRAVTTLKNVTEILGCVT
jgi:hypothetical protein